MARPPKDPPSPETPDPTIERPDDAGSRRDTAWLIAQQIHELTSDFARTAAKTDRLVADVAELSREVKDLGRSLTFAKGFGIAAVILIPMCASIVWWLIGGKLNDIRDQLYASRPAISGPSSPGAVPAPSDASHK
jgi:hypothetical protein